VNVPELLPYTFVSEYVHSAINNDLPKRHENYWSFIIINRIFLSLEFMDLPRISDGFVLGLLFDPEDGDSIFLRNVRLSPNYMALKRIETVLSLVNGAGTSN
jgi:hypothetical protein